MVNQESLRAVDSARWSERFVRPLYDSYCFLRLPATVEVLLTGSAPGPPLATGVLGSLSRRYGKVVLVLFDGFGWRFFERYRRAIPFLRFAEEEGVVSKLTSMFPSTTAVHVTAAHTGLSLKEACVCEWLYYEPRLDAVINPLLFSFAGEKDRNGLLRAGAAPESFLPRGPLYDRLAAKGVKSFVLQHRSYAFSPYSTRVTSGATMVPYENLAVGLGRLADLVTSEDGPCYVFFYWDTFDGRCHKAGPGSEVLDRIAMAFLGGLERLARSLRGRSRETLLLVTADHAQVEQDASRTVYLDRAFPDVAACVETTRRGIPRAPAGSQRDYFLYLKKGREEEVLSLLRGRLQGRAEVYSRAELDAQGLFGPGPTTPAFEERMGDVLVLPYANESVYWAGPRGEFVTDFKGQHGGLTPEEVETLLLALELG